MRSMISESVGQIMDKSIEDTKVRVCGWVWVWMWGWVCGCKNRSFIDKSFFHSLSLTRSLTHTHQHTHHTHTHTPHTHPHTHTYTHTQIRLYETVAPTMKHDLDKAAEKVRELKSQIADVKRDIKARKEKREEKEATMTEEEFFSTLSRGGWVDGWVCM